MLSTFLLVVISLSGCGYEAAEEVLRPPAGASCASCEDPDASPVAAVEIGATPPRAMGQSPIGFGCGPSGGFVPLADGDPLAVIRGTQGADMIVVRLRVTASRRFCAPHRTRVTDAGGDLVSQFREPVELVFGGEGTPGITRDIFLPGVYRTGDSVTITSTVAGATTARRVTLVPPEQPQ